jgi:hypothetical protein
MSLASLEKAILKELKEITNNKKLTKNSIMEWSTSEIKPEDGETLIQLPELKVWVCYK